MGTMMPRISVVVPAYNAEKCLATCLDSLLVQSFKDFELIVVDDGSKDGTAAICDGYATKDGRVKVIHKANGGVGAARNSGLEIASGEFVAFVDSDDSVLPDYLTNLIGHVSEGIDLVISDARKICCGRTTEERYHPVTVQDNDFDAIFANNVLHASPWSKLYRRSVLQREGLGFPEDMDMGEDAVFLLTFMADSEGVVVSGDADYVYVADGGGSLTKKLYSFEKEKYMSSRIDAAVDRLIEEKGMVSEKALYNLNLIKSLYRERALDAVYFSEKWGLKQRMDALKSIDTKGLRVFAYRDHGFRPWLLSHLLKWRMVALYDFVRSMASSVR